MPEKEHRLFRKSTLDRVSSPEELNEYIKITNPSLVMMIIGIFTILIAGAIWIFAGGIPKTVDLAGVAVTDTSGEQKTYCYVSIGTSVRLHKGMEVQISPDYASREEYGYKTGKILNIGTEVVTEEYIGNKFENSQLVMPLLTAASQQGNVVEIEMSMGQWSSSKGNSINIIDGTICQISAVIGQTKPYELIFNTNT